MANYPNYMGYQQPPMQYQQQGLGIEVLYAKESEAINYLVPVGKKVFFIITDKPLGIFKATDNLGFSTADYYEMKKLAGIPVDQKQPENYVRLEDLKGFVTEESFNNKVAEMSKQIEEIIKRIKIQNILEENNAKQ